MRLFEKIMKQTVFSDQKIMTDKPVGHVVKITSTVVDVEFPYHSVPPIQSLLFILIDAAEEKKNRN
jgi:hypothetical protein